MILIVEYCADVCLFLVFSIVYYYKTEVNFRKIYLLSPPGEKLAKQLLCLFLQKGIRVFSVTPVNYCCVSKQADAGFEILGFMFNSTRQIQK